MDGILISNQYSKELVSVDVDLEALLSNPLEYDSKDKIPQIMLVTLSEDSREIRGKETREKINALLIEYDNTLPLTEWIDKFGFLESWTYTTYSHTPAANKYRVILPLAAPVSWDIIEDELWRQAIMSYFGDIDKSCFKNYQKIPAKTEFYQWFHRTGKYFDIKDLEEDRERLYVCRVNADRLRLSRWLDRAYDRGLRLDRPNDSEEQTNNALRYAAKELDKVNWHRDGSGRYVNLLRICGYLRNCHFKGTVTQTQALDLILPYLKESKHKEITKNLINQWK